MVAAHGVCWAVAPFLFLRAEQPFAVASFLMVAALMPSASIPTQSNYPPAVYAIVALTLPPLAVRLLTFGGNYIAIAITLLLYCGFLLAFARVQSQSISRGIALRFENVGLVDALKAQRDQAEALRTRADQANLAKSHFLAAASHDLRQPLHALGLFAASLREMAKEESKREAVENMLSSIDALNSLFNELLDLSRMDAGNVQPRLRHFALETVFAWLRTHYAAMAQEKGLRLEMDETEVVVFSDAGLLERALGNLLANAIYYTEHGQVGVRAALVADAQVEIEVSDTGIGIAPEHHERVFDEFFQLHNPERDRRKGLGLGLSIVKRTAALLGYPLTLQSTPGAGTRISLRVPLGDAAKRSAEQTTQPDLDILRGLRILVVEDEASVRVGTLDLLRRWGCDTRAAADMAEVLSSLAAWQPEIVMADLRLRDEVSGIQVIDALRAKLNNDFAALIVSGDTRVEVLAEVKAKNLPMLHKPVRPGQLRAALSQLAAARLASATPHQRES
jgi:signal transduction histidine kinase/ActR/RegA family two-component response regulator